MKILVIDDEPDVIESVRLGFTLQWREVDVLGAASGEAGLDAVERDLPDIVLLDVGLPDIDGFEVLRQVRAFSDVPVVMLTARDDSMDKVKGLELGADDYVTKPFGPEELLARIRVALRRVIGESDEETGILRAGALTIDYDRRRVIREGVEIRLTPKELELLSLLARNHDRVLTHRAILKAVWGPNAVEQPEHLWTLVAQLRKKLEPDPASPKYLLSEPWVGYRFVAEPV